MQTPLCADTSPAFPPPPRTPRAKQCAGITWCSYLPWAKTPTDSTTSPRRPHEEAMRTQRKRNIHLSAILSTTSCHGSGGSGVDGWMGLAAVAVTFFSIFSCGRGHKLNNATRSCLALLCEGLVPSPFGSYRQLCPCHPLEGARPEVPRGHQHALPRQEVEPLELASGASAQHHPARCFGSNAR